MPIYIEETGANLFMWSLIVNGFLLGKHEALAGAKVDTMFIYLKRDHGFWGVPKPMWEAIGASIMKKITSGTFDISAMMRRTKKYGEATFVLCDRLMERQFTSLSLRELTKIFVVLKDLAYKISDIGLIPPASDLGHSLFTQRMTTLVRTHVSDQSRIPILMNLLMVSSRMTVNRREQIRLHEIALDIANHLKRRKPTPQSVARVVDASPAINRALLKHLKQFSWLPYNYQGPAWDMDALIDRIAHFLSSTNAPAAASRRFRTELTEMARQQRKTARDLKLTPAERFIVRVAQEFWFLKAYRAEVRCRANFILDKLLREIGKRVDIPWKLLRHTDPEEVSKVLRSDKVLNVSELKRRSRELFWLCTSGHTRIWSSTIARKMFAQKVEQKKIGDRKLIKGQTAYPGIARGRVKIVRSVKDIHKVVRGDIMVAIATNPDLLPAMNRAAAFVTDAGGITSHAAIVAREMKKPCVIGTEYATKVLKDGDTIVVDAQQGTIKKVNE